MKITYKSEFSIEECQNRLNNSLERSVNDNWGKDTFIGKVSGTKYKYYFHKAYMKNTFKKGVRGRMYLKNNTTYITTNFFSPHLAISNYLRIFIVSLVFIFIIVLTNANEFGGGFVAYLNAVKFTFIVVSSFSILAGIISLIMPISKENKDNLVGFLIKKLELEKVK